MELSEHLAQRREEGGPVPAGLVGRARMQDELLAGRNAP
jgi:hypothetical protein